MDGSPKLLLIVIAGSTVRLADAIFPVPPWVEETLPVRLFLTPTVVPVTLTVKLQLNWMATTSGNVAPPVSEIAPEPDVAETIPAHEFVSPFGVATTRPAGRLSTKLTPLCDASVTTLKLSVVVLFKGMDAAPKDLLIDGAAASARGVRIVRAQKASPTLIADPNHRVKPRGVRIRLLLSMIPNSFVQAIRPE